MHYESHYISTGVLHSLRISIVTLIDYRVMIHKRLVILLECNSVILLACTE